MTDNDEDAGSFRTLYGILLVWFPETELNILPWVSVWKNSLSEYCKKDAS